MSCVQHTEKPKRVVVHLDPRELTRTALRRSFSEGLPGTLVVGVADLAELRDHITDNLRLVVVHIDRADLVEPGSGLLATLRQALASVPFVTLAGDSDPAILAAVFEAGASAHLTTAMPLDRAAATLRLVMLGGTAFPVPPAPVSPFASAADGVVRAAGTGGHPSAHGEASSRLTRREEDVLRYVGEGAQNKTIAFRLNMSENTVKVHLHRILQKLRLHNRTEVALRAHSYFTKEHDHPVPTVPAMPVQMMAQNESVPEAVQRI